MMLAGAVVGGEVEVEVEFWPADDPPLWLGWANVLVIRSVEVIVERTRLEPSTTVVKTEVIVVTEGVAEAVEFPLPVGCVEFPDAFPDAVCCPDDVELAVFWVEKERR